METISVAISDCSDVIRFGQYLINIFAKSMKAQRCTGVMFKLTFYCLSVAVEDLNLWPRYRYEDINILGTHYFIALDSILGAQ